MFVVTNSMFGLLILCLGILGIVVSFLITQRTRYLAALALSGLLILLGAYFSLGTTLRQWRTARKIAKIQAQNRLTLEAIQNRILQQPVIPAANKPPAAVQAPVAARPAAPRRPAPPRR